MSEKNMYDKAFDLLLHEALSEVEAEENPNLPDLIDVDFSDEHKATMKKIFDKEKKKVWRKKFYKSVQRMAACVIALVIVAGISVMSVSAWRVQILNFIFNKQQTNTEVSTNNIPEDGMYETDKVSIGYIPEGFTLAKRDITDTKEYLRFDNGAVQIGITIVSSQSTATVDTEETLYEEMMINNNKALYAEKNGESIIVICGNEEIVTIQGKIGKEEIVKIARNLKIK